MMLNNDVKRPALRLGIFQTPPEQTVAAVDCAIASWYRLIDTAAAYFNERQVGEEIVRSGIDRSEIFVTTKLWISDYGYERALRAFDASLRKLGLDYVDRYPLHWPVPSDFEAAAVVFPIAREGGSAENGCSVNRASVCSRLIIRIMKETSR
jgi:diketogulonate reductase-like aldo/keto reductase